MQGAVDVTKEELWWTRTWYRFFSVLLVCYGGFLKWVPFKVLYKWKSWILLSSSHWLYIRSVWSTSNCINNLATSHCKCVWESGSEPCSSLFSLEQSTLMYCISSMSCTSTLSSEHTVSSCSLGTHGIQNKKSQTSTLFPLKTQQSWNGRTAFHLFKIILTLYFCKTHIELAIFPNTFSLFLACTI